MDEAVLERIKRIEERLDTLEKIIKTTGTPPSRSQPLSLSLKDMLDLPSSLQKTMLTIQELKEGTATEVSKKTGRERSIETIYLNQLVRLGYLSKERKGRRIYFKILRYY